MSETLETRLARLAAQDERSHQTASDDRRAFHAAVREADEADWSVRTIARIIGKSVAQTHRIMARLTGPDAE